MEEQKIEHHHKVDNNGAKQIAGAILIVGVLIAGAILLRGSSRVGAPAGTVPISKQIGLKIKSFDACIASGKFKDKVQADIDDGIKAGVTGTPSSFMVKEGKVVSFISDNGISSNTIPGAQPYETIMKNLERIKNEEVGSVETKLKPVNPDDHIIGNINAKIIIVEYSDLDCPFCKTFHKTMHRVVKDMNGDVAWVYRHYPIPQLHPNAFQKAEATECAWEQGGNDAFWKYTDKVFEITS